MLPELFGRRRGGASSTGSARRSRDAVLAARDRSGRRSTCSTPPSWRSTLRRARAGAPRTTCATRCRPTCRCSTCRTCSPAQPRRRAPPRQVADALAEELATDGPTERRRGRTLEQLLAAKEIVDLAAARAASARPRPRRRSAPMAAVAPRRQGARAHRRPGPAAGQRARPRAFGNVETPGAARERSPSAGVEPRGELWAAMLDTKQSWDDLVRRHAPDADAPATRSSANPLYQNITGRSCRATTTSRWSGSTRSTRRAATT